MPQYPTCQHIKTKGAMCESPALKGSRFCYFHHRDLQRQSNFRQARDVTNSRRKGHFTEDDLRAEILESLQLPLLEDGNAIQVALTNVARAIAGNHIAERRAALLLYSLQIAVCNINNVHLKLWNSDSLALADPHPIADLNPLAPASTRVVAPEEKKAS
ncbi:MAG: hypothetical protein ACRD3A_15440 [Terriglobales bacterium]